MSLGYKMLLRKRGTGLSILAISLLVAIPASMGSVVNYINSQVEILGGLVIPSKTYIIMSKNSTPSESRVNISLEKLRAVSNKIFPQKIIQANLTGFKVRVRGISNMSFLTGIKGRAAENIDEADVGKILAKTLNISIGENITLSAKKALTVRVVGIIESKTQLDAEIIVPLETAWELSGDRSISLILIEDPKDDKIRSILPDNLELVQAQCIRDFVQQTNLQTLSFLNAWSIAVYAAVSAASYTIATRLITESSYELTMLSALGAKKTPHIRTNFMLHDDSCPNRINPGDILRCSRSSDCLYTPEMDKKHGNIPVSRSPPGISNPSSNPSFISFRVHLPSS